MKKACHLCKYYEETFGEGEGTCHFLTDAIIRPDIENDWLEQTEGLLVSIQLQVYANPNEIPEKIKIGPFEYENPMPVDNEPMGPVMQVSPFITVNDNFYCAAFERARNKT